MIDWLIFNVIYQTRNNVFNHISKHWKKVESKTNFGKAKSAYESIAAHQAAIYLGFYSSMKRLGVFVLFQMFGNVAKHCLECLLYLLSEVTRSISTLRGFCKCGQTLFWVLFISSQSKLKLRRKWIEQSKNLC